MLMRMTIAVVLCCTSVSSLLADGPNWPQWRGPNGTGKTSATGIVTHWGPEQNVKWKLELPEAGNSTPVVWGNRIFVTQPLSETNARGFIKRSNH